MRFRLRTLLLPQSRQKPFFIIYRSRVKSGACLPSNIGAVGQINCANLLRANG